jgi:ABC-type multidrug transport system ATPase subunit/pSer/pThr/pTyr-binding forkhead associated (FHA) protein
MIDSTERASGMGSTQSLPAAQARVTLKLPDGSVQTIALHRPSYTIGRHPTNDIVVPIPTVSSEHALIERRAHDGHMLWRVVDRGSRNGTVVNGRRITTHVLREGDIVRIGDALGNSVSLRFETTRAYDAVSLGRFDLGDAQTLSIGRDPANDLPLDSPLVSRRHARAERVDAGHALIDLGSTNGTYVNGVRLEAHVRRLLRADDLIQIGPFNLTYRPDALRQQGGPHQARIDALNLLRRVDGRRVILNEVSLSILPREFVAIVGGSGSGKTTLLNALSGFKRAEGRVLLNGDDFYAHYALYRTLLGYVPQDDIIHAELPVDQALRYVARLRLPRDTSHEEIEQRIGRVLAEVEMAEHRTQLISSLSGGQRKRVSIGAELLAEPGVFFLDEATSGLDPGLEKKLMYTLRRMADAGRTIVLVTHATANIRQCDHVAFMGEGRLVFFGPPAAALDFFGVSDFADIYAEIDRDAALWEERFRVSTYAQQYLQRRLSELPPAPRSVADNPLVARPRVSWLRQFAILAQRAFELSLRDKVFLAVALAVMPVIGLLLSLLATPDTLVGAGEARIADIVHESGRYSVAAQAQTLLMMLALAAVLLGMFTASFELVKERAVYRRERMLNLRLAPYLGSKALVLSGFALLQCLALIVVVGLRVEFPKQGALLPAPLEVFITLALAALAGVALGLFISALVNNSGTAIYVVLLALFVQIMFAGVIFELPGAANLLSSATITRWTVEALGSTVDLPALNDLGRIEVARTVEAVDPLSGQIVQREVLVRDNLRASFNLNYGHAPNYVLERWAVLMGLAAGLGLLTVWAQRRRDAWN